MNYYPTQDEFRNWWTNGNTQYAILKGFWWHDHDCRPETIVARLQPPMKNSHRESLSCYFTVFGDDREYIYQPGQVEASDPDCDRIFVGSIHHFFSPFTI